MINLLEYQDMPTEQVNEAEAAWSLFLICHRESRIITAPKSDPIDKRSKAPTEEQGRAHPSDELSFLDVDAHPGTGKPSSDNP